MLITRRLFASASLLIAVVTGCNDSTVPPDSYPPATAGSAPVAMAGMTAAVAGAGAPPAAGATPTARPTAGSVASGVAGQSSAAAGTTGGATPSTAAGSSAAAAGSTAGPDAPTPTAGAAAGAGAAGSGAIAGTGAVAGAGGAAAPAEHEDLGMGDGSDVITIGDSWMSYGVNGGGIERGLLEASGQPYRTYGVAGTMLLNEVIPGQYTSAKRENPDIKTVVMTGGGNDLLLTGMTAAGCGAGCMDTINTIGVRLTELWTEMAADGVQDVVYIEYSRGGGNADGVNYAHMVIPQVCAAAPLRCHFIDSDDIIMMELLDGVHPTADGCTKLGKASFDLMVEKGMRR
jgi:hypothetical protein